MVEDPPWDTSSSEFCNQEQSMFDNRGQFVSPNTPARGQIFSNSVTFYACVAADVIYNDNYATVLKCFIITLYLQIAQVKLIRNQQMIIWFLPRSGVFHPRKHLIQFAIPHSMVFTQYCILPYHGSSSQMIMNYVIKDYHIMCTVIHCCHYSV